ncbi:DUF2971 domain-containing protein [Robiginitalea sp. IMCC43444]|uniref:DUF2971 domain-containing protein n=1 Tax=Robiginitalea sp. IMCC43444 TaxID=3459121 RepID=UPI0040433646
MKSKSLQIAEAILKHNYQLLNENFLDNKEVTLSTFGELLFHYTNLNTFSEILNSDNLWLFDSRYCNDEQEYEDGLEKVKYYLFDPLNNPPKFYKNEIRDDYYERSEYETEVLNDIYSKLIKEYEVLNKNWFAYITSFSKPRFPEIIDPGDTLWPHDNLSMWRGYAKDGQGVCIGFEYTGLSSLIEGIPGLYLVDVIYKENQKEFFLKSFFRVIYDLILNFRGELSGGTEGNLNFELEEKFGTISINEIFEAGALVCLFIPSIFKHEGFIDEREARLVYIPSLSQEFDKRVQYLRERPYVELRDLLEIKQRFMLPITQLTIGPSISPTDKINFLKSRLYSKCTERSIAILKSKIPYRSSI